MLATLLCWPGIAQSQTVIFNLSTLPTFVANTGRSEAMGYVVLTADVTCGTNADGFCVSTAGTIQVLYGFTSIDNSLATANINTINTNGIEVCEFIGAFTCNAAGTYLSGPFVVTNTVPGGVVAFGVKSAVDIAAGDQLIIRGVRGQIDLSPGSVVGTSIVGQLTASPSTIAVFFNTSEVVARSADPLTMGFSSGTLQQCNPSGRATLTITEGFTTAFVDHGDATETSFPGAPSNQRPSFGGTNNSRINLLLTNKPAGVTITWPTTSDVDSGSLATGARLDKASQSASGAQATYVFSTPDQALTDVSLQIFNIHLDGAVSPADGGAEIALSLTSDDLGTANAQGQMFPPTVPTSSRPRYSHPLEPVAPATFLTVQSCGPASQRRNQTVSD
ncbi:MAG: hypothetical protein HY316_03715 [Acidobacteria bacterium]|nr:hypothetical protein [Acidobacteriota bacterium]